MTERKRRGYRLDKPTDPVGVPRRFSLGTLMIFATLYSVLFALLTSYGARPELFVAVPVFITGVGVAQMFLFGGKKPREASVMAGVGLFLLLIVPWFLYSTWTTGGDTGDFAGTIFFCVLLTALFGPLLGYVAGVVAAGLFVFMTRDADAMLKDEEELARLQGPFGEERTDSDVE